MSKAKMIGKGCPEGVGGRDCICCGQAPGKARKTARRAAKRSERNAWRADANDIAADRLAMEGAPSIIGGWLAVR
jgi:hypothetical protein